MPGVTGTSVCFPCAPTTVTKPRPDAVATIAATGTVSTGPTVRPVSTVIRTFSPFSAAGSGLEGRTVTGRNTVALEPLEPLEPPAPAAPADPVPEPDEADEAGALPMSTTAPVGTVVVAVPMSDTVPVAWMPVTSSKIFTFRPAFTWEA